MNTKRGSTILSDFVDNVWYIYPENFRFLLDLVTSNINFDEKLALEKRLDIQQVNDSRSKVLGDTGIAYIPVRGTIHPRASLYTEVCGGTSITALTSEFVSARDNPNIKAILFDHDSPGGIATGINAFSELVYNSRGSKPIYSFVDGTCASADFWIASAASKLIIDPTARLGSVGTVVGVPKKGADEAYIEITNSMSPYKRPDVEKEDHYKSIVKYLDEMTDVFYDSLSKHFSVSRQHVIESFGKGGLKVGENAVIAKMASRTGSFDSCVEEILSEVDSGKFVQVVDNLSGADIQKNGGNMDIKELRANHPEVAQEIEKEAVQKVELEVNDLKEKNKGLEDENNALKGIIVAKEKELSTVAASEIFSSLFSESSIPSKFSAKVEKDTNLSAFINEDGKLDKNGYSESCSAAIASWAADFEGIVVAENGSVADDSEEELKDKKVLGTGTPAEEIIEEDNKTDESLIDRLLNMAIK